MASSLGPAKLLIKILLRSEQTQTDTQAAACVVGTLLLLLLLLLG